MAAVRAIATASTATTLAATIAGTVFHQITNCKSKKDREHRCNEKGYHKSLSFLLQYKLVNALNNQLGC